MKHYSFWIVLLFILLSGSYIIFREFYYFGTLHLYISEENTTVTVEGKGEYTCEKNFCSIEIVPNTYLISVEKDGYKNSVEHIEIVRGEITEQKIILEKNSVSLSWKNEESTPFTGKTFPLKKSFIDSRIENFSITDTQLRYNNSPLFPLTKPISLSSDEIGRNVWIVFPQKIAGFSLQYKTLFPVFSQSIKRFYPQKNGFFSWEDFNNSFFYYDGKQSNPLLFSPHSLFLACKIPSFQENKWAYLADTKQGLGFFIHEETLQPREKSSPLILIENLSAYDVLHIQCIDNHSIEGVTRDNTVFVLSF